MLALRGQNNIYFSVSIRIESTFQPFFFFCTKWKKKIVTLQFQFRYLLKSENFKRIYLLGNKIISITLKVVTIVYSSFENHMVDLIFHHIQLLKSFCNRCNFRSMKLCHSYHLSEQFSSFGKWIDSIIQIGLKQLNTSTIIGYKSYMIGYWI